MLSAAANQRRRGATVAEFAIVAPVFFLILLGIIEVSRAVMVQHLLTNAARAGCRVGVLNGKSTSAIKTAVNNVLTPQGISGDTPSVLVNDGTADASTAQSGDEITVTVSVPTTSITWLPFARYLTGTISGQYTLRRE